MPHRAVIVSKSVPAAVSPTIENHPTVLEASSRKSLPGKDAGRRAEILRREDEHRYEFSSQWDALLAREECKAYARASFDPADYRVEREKVCRWCYEVADHYHFERSIVSVALSFYDRLASNDLVEKRLRPLAGLTCLYLAVKIHSSRRHFDAKHIASFSSVYFMGEDVIAMEDYIFQTFDWSVNPPVPSNYIDIVALRGRQSPLLRDMSEHCSIVIHDEVRQVLLNKAMHMCELLVLDAWFCDKRPSSCAVASMLVAMDVLRFPATSTSWFKHLARDVEETDICAERLRQYFNEEDQPLAKPSSFTNQEIPLRDNVTDGDPTVTRTTVVVPPAISRGCVE